jgi:hypothetical protein
MTKHKKASKQRLYKMKGCSNKKTRKNYKYLGGSPDSPLSYPSSNVPTVPNTNLAYDPTHPNPNQQYTSSNSSTSYSNTSSSDPTSSIARAYPSSGAPAGGFNFLNQYGLRGGGRHRSGCKCSLCKSSKGQMGGGGCGCGSGSPVMLGGGSKKHRPGCRCNLCRKKIESYKGGGCSTSNNGIPYPNGLLGNAWTPNVKDWPGIDGISMDRNHLGYNTYSTDVSRQIIDVGPSPPFTYMKGGRTRKNKKGGTLSNFLKQDFVNLGRQFQFNAGSTWNALRGYQQPVNPLPWKDQLTRQPVAPP